MASEHPSRRRLVELANVLGRPSGYIPVALALLVLPIPLFFPAYVVHVFIVMFITGTGAVAWNIIGGFGGQFSLGNAMFLGIGGYTTGIVIVEYGASAWAGLALGVVLAVVAAVVVGYPSFMLTGHYFALATIAVVEGLWFLSIHYRDVTGGSTGYSVLADPGWRTLVFGTREPYFYLTYVLFLASVAASIWVRRSRLGYYLLAIRENEDAAESIGIGTTKYKMYGWIISAILTAIAGGLYAVYLQFLYPDSMFSLDESILYALIVLIGGIGTIVGPILGTLLLVPLEEYTTTVIGGDVGALSYVGYGVLLILFILYAPDGLADRLRFVGEYVRERAPRVSFDET